MSADPPFQMLDEAAIRVAELQRDPYDYVFVDQAILASERTQALADAPAIPGRGSYVLPGLRYGPKFAACMQDLLSPRFRALVEQKFDIDLSRRSPCIVMTGNTAGRASEGYAHPDSRHKIVTVVLGFSEAWPHEHGRLRVLRSSDRDDFAFEFAPEFGKMLMFRVCDHSWHGFVPQKGKCLSIELCYVDSDWYVRQEYFRHRLSAVAKSIPVLREILDWAPRRFVNRR
jgi:hypothetical protein